MPLPYRVSFRPLPVLLLGAGTCLFCVPLTAGLQVTADAPRPVAAAPPAPPAFASGPRLAEDERLWGPGSDRVALLRALDANLRYLDTGAAARAYQVYARQERERPTTGGAPVSRERVRRSLRRLRHLVQVCRTPATLDAALRREFVLSEPAGDAPVQFTSYYEPVYPASRVRTAVFRWPLYRPISVGGTRRDLEGEDGVAPPGSPLRGRELIYLKDRMAAFLVQVQGSARLELPDGRRVRVSNAGTNGQPYTSIGRELVRDGKIAHADLTLPVVLAWFRSHPEELSAYLSRNRRLVYFGLGRDTARQPPGSAGVPLTPERSIATDKRRLPPGAPAIARFDLVNPEARAVWGRDTITRLVLDQDAGSAIRGAARVDLYAGSGAHAERRAGVVNAGGRLGYLLLRP
jgi:membrane-bound lytic murein transglycosylase A